MRVCAVARTIAQRGFSALDESGFVIGFRPHRGAATGTGSLVGKPPGKEPAQGWAGAAGARYGDWLQRTRACVASGGGQQRWSFELWIGASSEGAFAIGGAAWQVLSSAANPASTGKGDHGLSSSASANAGAEFARLAMARPPQGTAPCASESAGVQVSPAGLGVPAHDRRTVEAFKSDAGRKPSFVN